MDVTRIVVLVVAVIAAGGAAFLVRGFFGGSADPATAAISGPAAVVDVLVAGKQVEPGRAVDAAALAWQPFPKERVSPGLITRQTNPDALEELAGTVARAGFWPGEPVTESKLVRAGATGLMAARLRPGMRAISIKISAETGAGGFILPNDRVDVILTRKMTGQNASETAAGDTVLRDVRVLAIDQSLKSEEASSESVVGKTATLELSSTDAETLAIASALGTLHLALRSLGEPASEPEPRRARANEKSITVIRYGAAQRMTAGN